MMTVVENMEEEQRGLIEKVFLGNLAMTGARGGEYCASTTMAWSSPE